MARGFNNSSTGMEVRKEWGRGEEGIPKKGLDS